MDLPIPEEPPVIKTTLDAIVLNFQEAKYKFIGEFRAQKKASYLHHTATTTYLCCVPALEDSAGAGCVGLAGAKIQSLVYKTMIF